MHRVVCVDSGRKGIGEKEFGQFALAERYEGWLIDVNVGS